MGIIAEIIGTVCRFSFRRADFSGVVLLVDGLWLGLFIDHCDPIEKHAKH
jgi:hypothetical protein